MSNASSIQSRPFNGDADVQRLTDFLIEAGANGVLQSFFHVGDLLWGLYQNVVYDPHANVRLWEDAAGELVSFAWFEEPGMVIFQLHPRHRADDALREAMLQWASERAARLQASESKPELWARFLDDDDHALRFFTRHGFVQDEYVMDLMAQSLDQPCAVPVLPDGFVVRHVGGEDEWAQRVELHRTVWHPSKVTLPAYQRLRSVPGYLPELDLVVVAPDGTFASYCICWLDPVNHTGEFEPVGTHPDFRGRGLGKAVIQEGLRRLKAHGAHTAIVYSAGTNEASRRLYESAGFHVVKHEVFYCKPLAS